MIRPLELTKDFRQTQRCSQSTLEFVAALLAHPSDPCHKVSVRIINCLVWGTKPKVR